MTYAGKVDMLKDTKLQPTIYAGNKTIYGIFVDSLFGTESSNHNQNQFSYQRQKNERKLLHDLVMQYLNSGAIKPLNCSVFNMADAEDAFRYMATGKHIGKCSSISKSSSLIASLQAKCY